MTIDKKIKLAASTKYDLDIVSYLCQDAILSKEEFFFRIEIKVLIFEKISAHVILFSDLNFPVK